VKWAQGAFKHHHEKSMVVDDRVALIATFNFTYSSFTRNREYGLLTTQPDVVAEVAEIFEADWRAEPVRVVGDSPLVLSPENSRARITALIRKAEQQLWLEQATLLDDDITDALIDAVQRGVDVRFIAPLREEPDAAAENLQRLQDAGGRVVLLEDPYIHAKAILADHRTAFIGSVNLSYTSFELNRELGILTTDEGVIRRLAQVMAQDWRDAGGDEAETLTPTTAPPAPAGVIPWQDAERYVGQEVTVQGEIVRTYDSGKVTFLNFDEDYRNTLTIVIFPSLYDAFPEPPASYFLNKTVQVTGKVKLYEGTPEIVLDDPTQIQIVGAPAEDAGSAPASPAPQPAAASQPPVISWQDAGDYIGQRAVVEGVVVRTYNSGKAAFLNFDEDWRGTFSVVIFASDFDAFPAPPEAFYLNKRIRVHGKIKEYKGAPEIIVESPDQIEILEEVTPPQATTPQPTPTPPSPSGVIPWQQAGEYVGQTITVEGRIIRTKDIGSITFLNFSRQRGDFVVIVRAEDYDNFPAPPAELYRGKKVWVTGEVTIYKGTPQIRITGPDQIEVFDE
jgi:DNA/RNA endonuclease YhcR with UshA esterase domain/HKD family nuclease